MESSLPKIQVLGNNNNGSLGLFINSSPALGQDLVMLGNTVVGKESKQRTGSSPSLADYMGVQNSSMDNRTSLQAYSPQYAMAQNHRQVLVPNTIQHANPVGYNVGAPVPYVVQPIIIQQEGRRHRKKKKSSGKDKNAEGGPGAAAIENYLDKQNQLMARILRDMKDDKRIDYLNQKVQLDHQLLNMNGGPYTPSKGYKYGNSLLSGNGYDPYANGYADGMNQMYQQNRMPYNGYNNDPNKGSTMNGISPYDNGPRRPPNRARGRKLLRGVMWGLALPGMWFISVVKWAEQRREDELKILEDEIPENLELFLEFAASAIEKEITNFVTDKNSMVIVQNGNVKSADMDKRCKLITDHLILILDHLSLQLDSGKLPPSFFEFMAAISEDDAVIPENFLSGFEIKRLYFNMFGNLKYTDEWRTKMVSGCFILLKGVLYFLMLRPWTVIPSIQEKQVNIRNVINAGSVLYHVILEVMDERAHRVNRSLSDCPFKPTPPTFSALEPNKLNKVEIIPDDNTADDHEVISGFYSKDRLGEFLVRRSGFVAELKEAILDFMDVLYDLTHNALERKWHVKQRFENHRPRYY